ncbi:MAG: hypothetical protein ABR564_02270 [Candidatus Dormibacteria bacterium]
MPPRPRRVAGPLERTALELRRIHCEAAFGRSREVRSRMLLRESDALMDLVEECRLRDYRLVPAHLHSAVVRFIRRVDHGLRDELGINRHPNHVSDILFAVQGILLERADEEKRPMMARIIPLFPDVRSADRRTG